MVIGVVELDGDVPDGGGEGGALELDVHLADQRLAFEAEDVGVPSGPLADGVVALVEGDAVIAGIDRIEVVGQEPAHAVDLLGLGGVLGDDSRGGEEILQRTAQPVLTGPVLVPLVIVDGAFPVAGPDVRPEEQPLVIGLVDVDVLVGVEAALAVLVVEVVVQLPGVRVPPGQEDPRVDRHPMPEQPTVVVVVDVGGQVPVLVEHEPVALLLPLARAGVRRPGQRLAGRPPLAVGPDGRDVATDLRRRGERLRQHALEDRLVLRTLRRVVGEAQLQFALDVEVPAGRRLAEREVGVDRIHRLARAGRVDQLLQVDLAQRTHPSHVTVGGVGGSLPADRIARPVAPFRMAAVGVHVPQRPRAGAAVAVEVQQAVAVLDQVCVADPDVPRQLGGVAGRLRIARPEVSPAAALVHDLVPCNQLAAGEVQPRMVGVDGVVQFDRIVAGGGLVAVVPHVVGQHALHVLPQNADEHFRLVLDDEAFRADLIVPAGHQERRRDQCHEGEQCDHQNEDGARAEARSEDRGRLPTADRSLRSEAVSVHVCFRLPVLLLFAANGGRAAASSSARSDRTPVRR